MAGPAECDQRTRPFDHLGTSQQLSLAFNYDGILAKLAHITQSFTFQIQSFDINLRGSSKIQTAF